MAEIAYITPKVLKWARTTAKISLEDAAKKLKISEERLAAWEDPDSKDRPTIRQAEILARAYRRPFALLFLPDIPRDFQPLQDFRRTGSKELTTSAEFIIREVRQKQAWISEFNQENGEAPLSFVGRFTVNDDPATVGRDMLKVLGIDPAAYDAASTPLQQWVKKAEAAGIFISRTSFIHSRMRLDHDEFQGFAISDPFAPFVFINTDDWKGAQLFTLAHELAHIWIGATGISTDTSTVPEILPQLHPVERFCNAVAAHALMPGHVMDQLDPAVFTHSASIMQVAKRYGVSSLALLIQARDRKMVKDAVFRTMRRTLEREFNEYRRALAEKETARKKSSGGPDPNLLRLNRNGRLFTQVVLDAYRGGHIQPTEASSLLEAPVNRFPKFEKHLYA